MDTDRKKRKQFVHIGNILDKTLRSFRRDLNADLCGVWDVWDGLVGEAVAENARPVAFKGKTLLVDVSSSVWKQHLGFLKADIISKINDALENHVVDDIKFKIKA